MCRIPGRSPSVAPKGTDPGRPVFLTAARSGLPVIQCVKPKGPVGASREKDAWGNRSSGNANVLELSAAYDLDKSVQLRAYAGRSGGSMGVASGGEGYRRRYVGVAVTGWF